MLKINRPMKLFSLVCVILNTIMLIMNILLERYGLALFNAVVGYLCFECYMIWERRELEEKEVE